MTRSRSRTLRGQAALGAAVDWFGPPAERPEGLRGIPARNSHANREAILAFLADLKARGSRRVYQRPDPFDGSQESDPLGAARFRPLIGDPDIDGDEGCFGFGDRRITMDGVRIRMSAPGVIEMADRWGDDAMFGSHANASFDKTVWDTDEWDLPAPVLPLQLPADAVERFAPRATAIAADLLAARSTDRAAAAAAIVAHWSACRPYSHPPPVVWFASPGAALDARSAEGVGSGNLRRDLRDLALFAFDQEATVKLNGSDVACGHSVWNKGRGTAIRESVWRLTGTSLGLDTQRAMLDLIVARGVWLGFDYIGLIADHERLAFYEFLLANGAELSETAATFCAMIRSVWLLFPTPAKIYAVDRPTKVIVEEEGLMLVFSDDDRLSLAQSTRD